MRRALTIAAALAAIATSACDEDAPDGSGVVIETLDDQPRSPDFGVLLAVHARGGHGLRVAVEGGAFIPVPQYAGGVQTSVCFASSASANVLTVELSVRPADEEALLSATLFTGEHCDGDIIDARFVAVRPAPVNPMPEPGPDAGVSVDAAPDAPPDAGSNGGMP